MQLRSIQSPVVSSIPSKGSVDNHRQQLICYRQLSTSFRTNKIARSNAVKSKPKPIRFNVQASGATAVDLQPAETKTKDGEKDENLVFVAGATGKVGSRTVRELLKLGFKVRAGVRSNQRAEPLVKSVQQMKLDDAISDGSQPIEKLQLVECDLEKPEQIKPALANSSTVICCIGASEKEIFDVTGPYRIDFQATKNLIDAAAAANAKHFILVTSLGTNKFGFPAAVLNLFWGVLCWKRKAEEALLASGIPYTIVRPGGMERPTDSFKETHNLTLSPGDTLFGGLVSNLQVAELLAFMAKNPNLSYCKVMEVVAETTAPLTPMGDLLTKIPSQRPIPVQPKEPEAIKEAEPVPKKSTVSEASSSATETQSQSKVASARPLSPYTAYEGLKPPSSPIPTPPGGRKAVVEAVSAPPADLETSTESESESVNNLETSTESESESVTISTEPAPVVADLQKTRSLSPYTAYENLKPPTSPCPSTPSVSTPPSPPPPPSLVDNGSPVASIPEATASTPVDTSAHATVKPRPLSPYPMYENLKPPSSPTPSTPQ